MTFPARRPNYYDRLGVTEDATAAEIQQAFRRCAKQFHPDLNGSRHAREAFLAINEAYHVLRDARRRAAFDESLDDEMMICWDDALEEPVVAPAPKVAPRLLWTNGWFAGLGMVGVIGAATLLALAAPEPTGLPERIAMASDRVPDVAATAMPESQPASKAEAAPGPLSVGAPLFAVADEPPEVAVRPKAPAAPKPPTMDNWQATATPGQMPPVSALDILAEVPAAAPIPVAALTAKQQAPQPLAKRTAAALVSQVRKAAAAPVRVNRYQAAVQAAKARYAAVQAARARYAAAMAAKARMIRAPHHVVRKAMKRRYAAY